MKHSPLFLKASLACLVATLTACSGTYKHSVKFNPGQPIRIAVLPFAQVDESGAFVAPDESLLIDSVALVSSQLKQTPAQFMQTAVQTELAQASLDVVTPALVEAAFVHNGFGIQGSKPVQLDLARVFAANPKEVCTKLISCDAVLYGKVTTWDRSYYGLQSVSSVGLDLKLVSAQTGKVLFESTASDSDSRGLSKGPTGFSNLVVEPIKGLDNSVITELANDVAEKSIDPLNVKKRPEFLSSAPPVIIASAHDSQSGSINRGGKLTVLSLGTPGHKASFAIGAVVEGIPLIERSPGHYIGEYVPVASETFVEQPVTISLQDAAGRTTKHTLSKVKVSCR